MHFPSPVLRIKNHFRGGVSQSKMRQLDPGPAEKRRSGGGLAPLGRGGEGGAAAALGLAPWAEDARPRAGQAVATGPVKDAEPP